MSAHLLISWYSLKTTPSRPSGSPCSLDSGCDHERGCASCVFLPPGRSEAKAKAKVCAGVCTTGLARPFVPGRLLAILTGSPLSSYMSCSIWDVVLIIFFIALSLFCTGKIYIQGTNHGKRNSTGLSRLVGPRPVTGGVSQDCPDGDPERLTPSVKKS